ncbi:hypothetical protein BN1708_020404, partial [Verticillium longisporum]
GTGPGSVPRRY